MNLLKNCLFALCAATLVVAGCKKAPPPAAAPVTNGVTIDVPKLREAFPTPSPEAQAAITQLQFGLRYGQYVNALQALDTLLNSPGLTEPQKKVVTDVIEQVKQVIAKQQAAPATQ
jgi:hypothetical protein